MKCIFEFEVNKDHWGITPYMTKDEVENIIRNDLYTALEWATFWVWSNDD